MMYDTLYINLIKLNYSLTIMILQSMSLYVLKDPLVVGVLFDMLNLGRWPSRTVTQFAVEQAIIRLRRRRARISWFEELNRWGDLNLLNEALNLNRV